MKKLLALVLALVMSMSLVTISNAAFKDADSIDYQEAVDILNAVGVLIGDENGNFNAKAELTRGQAAKIIAYLDLGGKTADAIKGSGVVFTDVPASHWAAGYIEYCAGAGYVAGVGAGKFDPEAKVTGVQFAKMLLCALGYKAEVEGYTGSDYTIAIARDANKNDLFDGLSIVTSANLTREQAAKMAFNALKATVVEYQGGTNVTTSDGTSVIVNATRSEVANKSYDYDQSVKGYDKNGTQQLCEKLYGKDLKKTADKTDKLGRPASIWSYKGDEIGKYSDKADYTFVVSNNDFGGKGLETVLKYVQDVLDDDDLELSVANQETGAKACTFYANGETGENKVGDSLKRGTVVEVFVDDDDSDVITAISSYYYTLYQIDEVDTAVKSADAKKGVSAYITIDGTEYNDTDIPGYNAKTYVEDAYVATLIVDGDIIESYVATKVEGAIEGYKANQNVTMNGTKYTVVTNSYTAGDLGIVVGDNLSTDKNDKYALYLDKNGYILGIDEVDANASIDDVYYVVKVWADDENNYGTSEDHYYAQIVDMNGVVKEIELENYYDKTSTTATLAALKNQAGTYNFTSLQDKFYTISDKKITSGNTTLSKANNDKYNLEAWPNADEAEDWNLMSVTFTEKLSSNDTRVTVKVGDNQSTSTYKVNADTKYLVLEETGKDLETTVKVGGLSYSLADLAKKDKGLRASYIITEDDSKTAKIVVLATDKDDTANSYSEDVLFVKSQSTEKGDGFRYQTVYWADGKKETIKVDDDKYPLTRGFYTYDTNKDGYYVLDPADPMEALTKAWKDEDGVLVNAQFVSYKDGMLTVTLGGKTYADIDVTSKVVYKDIHSTDKVDGEYDKTVNSLKALDDGMNGTKVKFASATVSLNVSEDGVVSVFVTNIQTLANAAVAADVEKALKNVNETATNATVAKTANGAKVTVASDKKLSEVSGTGLVKAAKALVADKYDVTVSFDGKSVTITKGTEASDFAAIVTALDTKGGDVKVVVSNDDASRTYTVSVEFAK